MEMESVDICLLPYKLTEDKKAFFFWHWLTHSVLEKRDSVCVCILGREGCWVFASKALVVVWTVMYLTSYSDYLTSYHEPLPLYNCNGWLDVKHQVTCLPWTIFTTLYYRCHTGLKNVSCDHCCTNQRRLLFFRPGACQWKLEAGPVEQGGQAARHCAEGQEVWFWGWAGFAFPWIWLLKNKK